MPRAIINTRGPGYRKAIVRRVVVAVMAVILVGLLAWYAEQKSSFGQHAGATRGSHAAGIPVPVST